MTQLYYYGTGRRKTSIARVFLKKGHGKIKINKTDMNDYFSLKKSCMIVKQPLELLNLLDKFDCNVNVHGGGVSSQSEAIRLGISRALVNFNNSMKVVLRKAGFVTRVALSVERKKVGFKKSRRRPQFSKR